MSRVVVTAAPAWPQKAAAWIVESLQRVLTAHPERAVSVALAGGTTPATVYRAWTHETPAEFDWTRLHFFLSDERMVPPGHADSNFRMARECLPGALHLHPVQTALTAQRAAQEYERLIRRTVPAASPSEVPRFDLVLLGVGDDGHTASLFPGNPLLDEARLLVSVAAHPQGGQERVTFTLPLIRAASQLVFLVAGAAKAQILSQILGTSADATLPAVLAVRDSGPATWLVDDLALSQTRQAR